MPDKYLLEHAEQWKTIKLNELHLNIISSISDATISPTNPNWKYWFDREKKTLNVILPAIKSEGELDDIIISGAMSQGGLSAFLSESQLDSLALSVFKACPEALQRSLLGQVLGDSGSNEAKIAAGKRRIIDSAMAAYKTSYKSQESNDWFIIVNNHIRNYLRHVVSFMSLSRPLFANAIGKGIRQNLSRLDNEMTLSNLNASSESLKEIIVELAERERKRLSIDRKRVITLGSVPEILIRYSPRIRHDALLELPLSALYGHQNEESPKRFVVVGVDKTKRDKHPFNLYEIKNFKESLASPLAIFNSTKNRLSTTVMLQNRCEFGNIFVPITRKENSKNDSGFGRWINTIDSVYPKDALNYIFLLSDKKNTLYVKDGFMEEWLVPTVKNLDDACEKKAKKFGINLPSDEECKKILSEYPERAHYEEENAEGPIKRLLSAADLNGPSGFLRMYAEYRVALESATKVVKESENPKILKQENIEFSVNTMSKYVDTKSDQYELASKAAKFLSDRLNAIGVKTIVVSQDKALSIFRQESKVFKHSSTVITKFHLSDGTIYGFQSGDSIYLTPEGINPNTPIHEYTHLWVKVFQKVYPSAWKHIKRQLMKTPLWASISSSKEYAHISKDDDRLAREVLSTLVGNKGEELLTKAAEESTKEGGKRTKKIKATISKFRQEVTDLVAENIFDAQELKGMGFLTLAILQDFSNGKLLSRNVADSFSRDYNRLLLGKMASHEVFNLGMPSLVLRSAGVKPIQIRLLQDTLRKHIQKHRLTNEIIEKIPEALQSPLMVYTWGEKSPSTTIITELDVNGSKLTIALQTKSSDEYTEVNDIRTLHLKDVERILNEISSNEETFGTHNLKWANKEKVLAWFSGMEALSSSIEYKQELISAANIIEKFDNPKFLGLDISIEDVLKENNNNQSNEYKQESTVEDIDFSIANPKQNNVMKPIYISEVQLNKMDSKTLSKAALFVAWELREDNPYEFIVDLSRAELEDFVKNSFNKLNTEDKDVVMNILKKTPGYGEDFVEKRINAESHFKPDIEKLLVDDLTVGGDVLDRSMFYIATRNMNDDQVQALRDSVKEKVMAYYAGIEMDAPNASMEKAEADTEKLLHSWFRPWTRLAGRLEYHLDKIHQNDEGPVSLQHIESEARSAMADERYAPYIERELKGWIRNRCVDYGLDYTKLPEELQYAGAAENFKKEFPELVRDEKNAEKTVTHNAIVAHLDKITALYPQEPTEVTRKADGTIVRQYGEFDYEQVKGGFEMSKNLALVEEVHPDSLQRVALYTMSSDSYGEHPNGPYVRFWDNGNIRSYENRSVHLGSDNEFESDMLSFTREGIVQEKIPGDYPIEPFLEDITKEYMKTMTQREGLEPNATADKIDSALLSTWFIFLPLEDKMRVFGYYHNNPDVEESPIGFLNNAMDVEKLEKAYKTAVETPFDIPEIDDTVIRVSLEKELNTAFDSLSDASKEQIYRETVAAGIPGIEPSHSQNATAQESLDSTKNALIAGLAEAYHENQRKISLLEANFVAGHRRPVLEPWVKLTAPEKAAAIVKAAQAVNLLDREYGIESVINKEVPDEKIIETIARRGDEAFGRLFINYVDTHTKIKQGEVEIMNEEQFNAALAVAGSRVYGTLISSLSQAYHEKYKEDGITLEIATTWAQELAVRIEETIGGGNFFYPGRIDAKSLTNAIGKDYDESDRQLVLDKLSVMLRPFSFSIERTSEIQSPFTFAIPITSDFAFKLNDNHILGIGESLGADMLESFVRQGLGDTSPLSIEEVKGKIDSFASECKVVISLDNSTLEQRPFNDLDVCLDIISMTGMAGRDDRILVKEKSLAGGTIYTVANELLLSSGVSVFNAQLDENGRLLGYSDANANVVVSYANNGAVYSVNKQAWGEEGSQPQVKTDYTTQLIVDAFEDIKKHLSEKNINQLQEQIEALQKMEMPLRELSINLISEIIPQSRYLTSDMLERFDALKSAASRQMGNKLNMFKNAIHLIADNTTNMNLFELQGAFDKVSKIEYPLLEICEKNKDLPDAFNLARDFKLTLTNLEKAVSQATEDYKQYIERGERTNNTFWDRLLGRSFIPHSVLPTKEEIEEYRAAPDGLQYARDSFQLLATTIDPNNDAVSILDSLFENNQTAAIEVAEQQSIIESKSVSIGELTSLPLDYERQLEITGRIDGPVCLSNPGGEDILVCVQKDGDSLISMRSDDIMSAIDKISSQEEPMLSINVDGQHYQMRKDNYDSFKYGQGAYAVNAETGEKAYLIFDVKEKKVVKTEKFETVLSKKLQEEKAKADKAIVQSIGQKTDAPAQKRGGGMKKS